MKYICYVCGYTCDENNIPEKCPQCNCHSAHFEKMDMRYELRKISTDKSFVDAMMKLYEQVTHPRKNTVKVKVKKAK